MLIEPRFDHIDPQSCRAMWCNVLSFAWEDALDPPRVLNWRQVNETRKWFGSPDFFRVCQWAGVDADDFLSRYQAALDSTAAYRSHRRTGIAA
ncbi:hypothetical protein JJJ17_09295 [Paracoccus caeni]|uniref:Uncharacterized protein n=1 Tax=Paracoccus caeni TaxID=657651 RepID=A0A934W0U1_9RHOB|nr:hypothetical protein [Paracoccus caeni]MBK4216119.1 hypothetical protein [Paracoccus caeni]